MRRWLLALALVSAAPCALAGTVSKTARCAPRIILPGTSLGQTEDPLISPAPSATIIIPTAPELIRIEIDIVAPTPSIIPASRALTQAEAAPQNLPAHEALKKLSDSLSSPPKEAGRGQDGQQDENGRDSLGAAFDASRLPDDTPAVGYFAAGPLAPALFRVEAAARSLWSLLLPRFYRQVPMTVACDRSRTHETGHIWTQEKGHTVEIAIVPADSRGEVETAFGLAGQTRVQQKIEQLMLMAHEYAHVLFDSAVRKTENHPPTSAYSAMTEGFAVTMEHLFIDRLLARPHALGLSPRDAADLLSLVTARERWLAAVDSHYSEGVDPWRAAYHQGGEEGLLALLAALSAQRLIATPRSDPAYQLVVGDPDLLSAYLGRDADKSERRGLDAFAKAARGETLSDEESRQAAAAIERAGPDGRRRLFERTLLSDKRIQEPKEPPSSSRWWEQEARPLGSVEPVFALARLSPIGAVELARFLAEVIAAPGGAMRLFERRGLNEKMTAMVAGAETLPWDETDRGTWSQALTRWIIGPAS